MQILQSYLKRNLRSTGGGIINEVRFVANTNNTADLEYLSALTKEHAGYSITPHRFVYAARKNYGRFYSSVEHHPSQSYEQTVFLKLDDDIVYGEFTPVRLFTLT